MMNSREHPALSWHSMSEGPEPELDSWSQQVRPLLASVVAMAQGVERALRHGDRARALETAEVFLAELNRGRPWALADECPRADMASEMRAGLAVLRNGALLVRRIADASAESATEVVRSCTALLEQGRHHLSHVERFVASRD